MSKGPRAFTYITPEEYFKIQGRNGSYTLKELREMARDDRRCEVCGQPVWKLGGVGMCFPCTTGESDASEDYELEE